MYGRTEAVNVFVTYWFGANLVWKVKNFNQGVETIGVRIMFAYTDGKKKLLNVTIKNKWSVL